MIDYIEITVGGYTERVPASDTGRELEDHLLTVGYDNEAITDILKDVAGKLPSIDTRRDLLRQTEKGRAVLAEIGEMWPDNLDDDMIPWQWERFLFEWQPALDAAREISLDN